MKFLALVAILALTACSALSSALGAKPDPKPAQNLQHVTRLVAADPKPEDAAPNAQALAVAQEIASDASKSDVGTSIVTVGHAAESSANPWIALAGTLAVAVGGVVHGIVTQRKVSAVASAVDQHATLIDAATPETADFAAKVGAAKPAA